MGIKFRKLTAQGNDYIYIDLRAEGIGNRDWSETAKKLSDRHFGIGADGLVLMLASEAGDVKMRMFNADGSEGKMCGSALRAIVYILEEETGKAEFLVETASGLHKGWKMVIDGEKMVAVSLGQATLESKQSDDDGLLCYVNIGNRHQVRYLNDIDGFDLNARMQELLPEFEGEDWNYEFIEIDKGNMIRMEVWENGSGATLACGTGAGASVFAGWETGRLPKGRIKVSMPGGYVYIEKQSDELILIGGIIEVFRGELSPFI
ncbi:MAG: diaminopimelate epimerase [Candidatus Cloacimonetes bacterium]|nr:diaminopimelate epimerase [Candidatus Cloacimonadota bacterium]